MRQGAAHGADQAYAVSLSSSVVPFIHMADAVHLSVTFTSQ